MRLRHLSAAALLALGACGLDPVKPEDSLYFELAVNQQSFATGDSVFVSVRALNTVDKSVTLQRPCGSAFDVQIRNASGAVLYSSDAAQGTGCAAASPIVLPGNTDYVESFATDALRSTNGALLPAGQYLLDAVAHSSSAGRRINGIVVTQQAPTT